MQRLYLWFTMALFPRPCRWADTSKAVGIGGGAERVFDHPFLQVGFVFYPKGHFILFLIFRFHAV